MYYLFVLNDLEMGRNTFSYDEILDKLLSNSEWIFTNIRSLRIEKFTDGDKIVIYGAGKPRRCFVGTFEICGEYYKLENKQDFYKYFDYGIKIRNIDMWNKPVYIKDIKDNLEFIKDKKNYGLHLRQTSRKLEEKDYLYLIQQAKNNINIDEVAIDNQ